MTCQLETCKDYMSIILEHIVAHTMWSLNSSRMKTWLVFLQPQNNSQKRNRESNDKEREKLIDYIVSKQPEKPQKPQSHGSRSVLDEAGPQQKGWSCCDICSLIMFFSCEKESRVL